MDWEDRVNKTPRQLPGKGCSVAFYVLLGVMIVYCFIKFIVFRAQL